MGLSQTGPSSLQASTDVYTLPGPGPTPSLVSRSHSLSKLLLFLVFTLTLEEGSSYTIYKENGLAGGLSVIILCFSSQLITNLRVQPGTPSVSYRIELN